MESSNINETYISREEIISEIIDIEDDVVTMVCMLDPINKIDQVRNFSIEPMRHFKNLKNGNFVLVRITVKEGEIKTEFIEDDRDHSELFKRDDLFSKFKDSPFFKCDD